MNKKICVITGSRADYDLLSPIMEKIRSSRRLKLNCIATGSHYYKNHLTYKKILKDGFKINKKVYIEQIQDDESSILNSISKSIKKFDSIFRKNKYDAVLVLGDRYEIFASVISALFHKIPIIHISGGEVTEGAIDEPLRHAISKFSSFHFVTNATYKKRIMQLGENPKNIFYVGSTGVENINKRKLLKLNELQNILGIKLKKENYLITFHPVTFENDYGVGDFKILLSVLSSLENTGIIFTLPNADAKNKIFISLIKKFVKKNKNTKYFSSLGRLKYYSCLNHMTAIIGNSSSGLSEVPSFKKPTINLGNRQKGRILAKSVINCENVTKNNIFNAIKKTKEINYIKKLSKVKNPYYGGNSSKKIVNKLEGINFSKVNKKQFFDINFKL